MIIRIDIALLLKLVGGHTGGSLSVSSAMKYIAMALEKAEQDEEERS